ncbi:MAG: hypothetical protein IPI44_10770, partial [Sulfuritalea sp.]|nr:hypothetical protein [Sulfuritalea sp.]
EKRFHAADKNGDGMLSREEAYAQFPRAPKFFDEIDSNRDKYITLVEVRQARARRVEAAISGSGIGGGAIYVKPEFLRSERGERQRQCGSLFPGMGGCSVTTSMNLLPATRTTHPIPAYPLPLKSFRTC